MVEARIRNETSTGVVRVSAPARLHLGFLDLDGTLGRRFGSIGLALDHPLTQLKVSRSAEFLVSGADAERGLATLRRLAAILAPGRRYRVDIASAIPAHAGLGSGTQIALAIGAAIRALEGLDVSLRALAELADRGARSAIGLAAFGQGGFIVDAGRGALDAAPPVSIRVDFPETWRVLLMLDAGAEGIHGEMEAAAFARLPAFPKATSAHICHLVLMRLVPGLLEADIEAFGDAVAEIQGIVGDHFAGAQGGSPWTSPRVGRMARRLKELGAPGIGQSSWGPTGFAFAPSEDVAKHLYESIAEEAKRDGLEILIAGGRNQGATVEKRESGESNATRGGQK